MGKYIDYSSEEIKKWYDEYLVLISTVKVAEKFGINQYIIYDRLKKFEKENGLDNINMSFSHRKYTYDMDFFSRDAPESFYWAGFIAADGCITKHKGGLSLQIGLSGKDTDHLKKFANEIKYSGKIREFSYLSRGKTRQYCQLYIYGSKFPTDLSRFNICERKSLTYIFPDWLINHPLVNHFMRGYIDGDGCFTHRYQSKIRRKLSFSVCGTKQFLEIFRYILSNKCSVSNNITIYESKSIHILAYSGNINVVKIRDFIYKDSLEHMEMNRKKLIVYADWVNIPVKNKAIKIKASSIIDGSIIRFSSINEINKFGFTERLVRKCLKKELNTYKNYIWEFDNV